jgi:hypothetical protein
MTDTPPGAATPSSRTPRTRTELEALVLTELRMSWQCGGAIHVTVVAYDNYRVGGTWEVASCNPGARSAQLQPLRMGESFGNPYGPSGRAALALMKLSILG